MLNLKKRRCATNRYHTLIWINISEDCNWIESVRLQRHVSFAQARLSIPSQVIEETVIFSTYIGLTSNDWCLLKFYNITRNCWEDIHDLSEGCAFVHKALNFWCQILLEYSQKPTLKQTFFSRLASISSWDNNRLCIFSLFMFFVKHLETHLQNASVTDY